MKIFLFLFSCLLLSPQVLSKEKLGVLSVEDVLLRPYLLVREGQDGEFGLGETSVALSWFKTQKLGSVVRIGSLALRNSMLHFSDDVEDELGIFEAYAQVTGVYGRLRMGMIPIEFGVEGRFLENEILFPRSLFFENRVIPLRDMGLSYQVGNQGVYTRLAVHNGEGESNKDGRMFVTASWGWSNYRNFEIGASAMTGTTKPASTQSVTKDFLAGVDVNKEALWRVADAFLYWHPNNWYFLSEIILGALEQDDKVTKFNGGHVDLGYQWSPFLGAYLRYDHFDPNDSLDKDLQRKASLAIVVSDKYKTNSFFFMGTKVIEQGTKLNNDEARIVWRLTPAYRND